MARNRVLYDLTKEKYKKLHDEFRTDKRIAAHLFIDQSTLSKWTREHGVYTRKLYPSLEEKVELIKQMKKDGHTNAEIADVLRYKNANVLACWISEKRRKGIAI
jgi:transposase-like protein